MGQSLIIVGIIAMIDFLIMEYIKIKKAEAYDYDVERFRYIEDLSPEELIINLYLMSTKDKEDLLSVLINKSEHTGNNRQLMKVIRIFLIEEQNGY